MREEDVAHRHAVLSVSDRSMQKTIQNALTHIAVSESSDREWSLRSVTPTWIDGKAVEKTSQAWTTLLEHPDLEPVRDKEGS